MAGPPHAKGWDPSPLSCGLAPSPEVRVSAGSAQAWPVTPRLQALPSAACAPPRRPSRPGSPPVPPTLPRGVLAAGRGEPRAPPRLPFPRAAPQEERTHPRAWAGGVLGSAVRCPQQPLQLRSDAAPRSPPPPPPPQFGEGGVT